MGCVKSSHLDKYEKGYGGAYNLNQDTWLNRPPDGYHWETDGCREVGCSKAKYAHMKAYENQIKEGCGCEGAAIAGIAVLGGTGYGAAALAHTINTAEACGTYGPGCEASGDAAGCGAGGCGGCGGCGA